MAENNSNQQPSAETQPTADELLDGYLGASEPEQAPKAPRKVARPDDPEEETVEEDGDAPADDADEEPDEETEDTDGEDDAGEEEDDQSEEGRFVARDGRVKLDDGSTTTVAELLKGNLRQADYTRKTQEVGTLHTELQTRLADYAQQAKLVDIAINIMAAALPPEPDPSLLQPGEGHDPVGYTSQKLLWEHAAQQLQGLVQAKEQMDATYQQSQGTLLQRYAVEQKDKLLARHPELRDKAKLETYHSGLVKTLNGYGLGAEDLAQVYNADIIFMVEELGELRKIRAARKAAKRKAQGVPVMAPATRQSPSGKKARTRQVDLDTLRKTGGRGAAGDIAWSRVMDDILR